MKVDAVLILPHDRVPNPRTVMETPYGVASGVPSEAVLVRTPETDARALIYAAKSLGATRVLAFDVVQAVSPLLEEGDLVIPEDLIDQTKLRPFTFFVGKGYGFIKLNPPFCPRLQGAMLEAARHLTGRSFQRATYVGSEGPRQATPAELRMYRQWGGDVIGAALIPEAYLARELELCYGAVTAVGSGELLPLLKLVAAVPHNQSECTCGQSMSLMRHVDWRTWLG